MASQNANALPFNPQENVTAEPAVPDVDSVTCIGDEAFVGCSGLTNVTIGNGVLRMMKGYWI
jgi:hypothetical protein